MTNTLTDAFRTVRETIDCSELDPENEDLGIVVGYDQAECGAVRDWFPGRFQLLPIREEAGRDFLSGDLMPGATQLLILRIPSLEEPEGDIRAEILISRATRGLAEGGIFVLDIPVEDVGKLNLAEDFDSFNCLEVTAKKRFVLWGRRNSSVSTAKGEETGLFLDDLGDAMVALPCLIHQFEARACDGPTWRPNRVIEAFRDLEKRESEADSILSQCACTGIAIQQVIPLLPLKSAHHAMIQVLNKLLFHLGRPIVVFTAILKRTSKEVIREEPGFKEEIATQTPYLQVTVAELETGDVYDLT
jgi:hypothetical protein